MVLFGRNCAVYVVIPHSPRSYAKEDSAQLLGEEGIIKTEV
jgi:hypothetical protein